MQGDRKMNQDIYYLSINSTSLAHYIGKAIILPSRFYDNRPSDVQSMQNDYLILSKDKFLNASNCSIELILNEEESHFLTGSKNPVDAAAQLLKQVNTVVIKRGSNGALGQTRGGQLVQIEAKKTTVVNTTGAGDAFAAGFISIWAKNGALLEALESGTNLAAKCVALVGARPLI